MTTASTVASPPLVQRANDSTAPHNQWTVLGASVRGQSHISTNIENQDALRIHSTGDPAGPVVVAIADGHSDARCFRSAVGSRIAVDVAVNALLEMAEQPFTSASAVKRQAKEELPRRIEHLWTQAVHDHVANNAFTLQELDKARAELGSSTGIENNPRLAYGTTLVAALITQHYLLYVHVGDGDVITLSGDDYLDHPIPTDEQAGGATTSLCAHESWRQFRVIFQPIAAGLPVFISLSTDGVANSFEHLNQFEDYLRSLLTLIRGPEGRGKIESRLIPNLEHMAREGSGDDVTWVMLRRSESPQTNPVVAGIDHAQPALQPVENIPQQESTPTEIEAPPSPLAKPTATFASLPDNTAPLPQNAASIGKVEKPVQIIAPDNRPSTMPANAATHADADFAILLYWLFMGLIAATCALVALVIIRNLSTTPQRPIPLHHFANPTRAQ